MMEVLVFYDDGSCETVKIDCFEKHIAILKRTDYQYAEYSHTVKLWDNQFSGRPKKMNIFWECSHRDFKDAEKAGIEMAEEKLTGATERADRMTGIEGRMGSIEKTLAAFKDHAGYA